MSDILTLERRLQDLSVAVVQHESDTIWSDVEEIAQEIANALRTKAKDGETDNHTLLGRTSLPQSIKSLLATAFKGASIPFGPSAGTVLELFRIAANFCIDNDENRSLLLEAGVVQFILSIIEAYNEKVSAIAPSHYDFSIAELKMLRTALGALINTSMGHDETKDRLNSLEATQTCLKLASTIYPAGAWSKLQKDTPDIAEEEWEIRSIIASWGWRLVHGIRNVKNEVGHTFTHDVLPLLTPTLAAFVPPYNYHSNTLYFAGKQVLPTLVETDFDNLENACTLIESLVLDVEDVRLALARSLVSLDEFDGIPCFTTILDFVEQGNYPPYWSEIFETTERKRKEKEFGICKAALIKAVVEVSGEEKNAEILWDDSDNKKPGGQFVNRMVQWIHLFKQENSKSSVNGQPQQDRGLRDDLVTCASLSLGNLSRQAPHATALLSPPYEVASTITSALFISPQTDINLKHGITGLLKHLAQSASVSDVVNQRLGDARIIEQLVDSGIWDERADIMTDVVQLNAIGIVKQLCNANLHHTLTLTIPKENSTTPSGLAQILALVKRSDSISVKSEGSRVLVNVIKSLWSVAGGSPSQEQQRKREYATSLVTSQECADIIATLLTRSGRHPILVNEALVALTLLSTHRDGGDLVLKTLRKPIAVPGSSEALPASPISDVSSPAVPTPPGPIRPRLHAPRHSLDMIKFVLRNVDNPANYPIEIRINACSLLTQLAKHTSGEELNEIKGNIRPTLEKVAGGLQSAQGRDKMLYDSIQKVISTWA